MKIIIATSSGTLPFLPQEIYDSVLDKNKPNATLLSLNFAQGYFIAPTLLQLGVSLHQFLTLDRTIEHLIVAESVYLDTIPTAKQILEGKISLQAAVRKRVTVGAQEYTEKILTCFKPELFVSIAHTAKADVNQDNYRTALKLARQNLANFKTTLLEFKNRNTKSKVFAPILVVGGKFLCDSLTGRLFYFSESKELKMENTVRSSEEEIDFNEFGQFIAGGWVIYDSFHDNDHVKLVVDKAKFFELVQVYKAEVLKNTLKVNDFVLGSSLRDDNFEDILLFYQHGFKFLETKLLEKITEERIYLNLESDAVEPFKKIQAEEKVGEGIFIESAMKPEFLTKKTPLTKNCDCFACEHYMAGYIRHTLDRKEILGDALLFAHNLRQISKLVEAGRKENALKIFKHLQEQYVPLKASAAKAKLEEVIKKREAANRGDVENGNGVEEAENDD